MRLSNFSRWLMTLIAAMILPLTMMAAGTKPTTGSGSASSPYEISSAANLVWFRDAVNGVNTGTGTGVSICAKLTADISLSEVTWSPIGTSSKKYTGTFDGNGKKITNMSLAYTSTYSGFFGYIDGATIKDFSLAGTMTSETAHSGDDDGDGCVVGRANGASTISGVTCSVNLTLSKKSQKHIGGIVGGIYGSSSVEKCTYSGTLNVYNSTDCIGGIVGFATAACSGSIKNCLFSGKIITTSTGTPYLGGILGYTNDESKNFGGVQNCLSYGTFTYGDGATTTYVHGIVGRIRNYATTTKNNRYMNSTGACNTDGPSIPDTNTSVTLAQCKTGEVAWALNDSKAGTIWRQNLEGTKDNYPTLDQSHGRVYYIQPYMCNATPVGSMIYSNSSSKHTHYDVTVKADETSVGTGTVTQSISTTANHCYLTLTATPDEHCKFGNWKQGNGTYRSNPWTVEITGATTITYVFGYQLYAIDAKVNDSNMGSVSGAGNYLYNSETDLMATPKAGYLFDYWSDGTTKYSGTPWNENRNVLNQKVTGPATYTAYFKAKPSYAVTTKVNDSNMGTATGGGTYVEGTSVTLTATPKTGYDFDYWSDGTTKYNGTTASNGVNTLEITVSKKVTYTAYFKAKQFKITIGTCTNGTVSQTNANGVYDYNTKAVLTATPNAGYDFTEWQDGNTDNPRTITVTKSDTYTATFTKHINYYDITVSANNADYGTVTGGGKYAEYTQVTLTATPKEYCRFVNWSDGTYTYSGNTQSDKSNKLEITVASAKTYTANFERVITYTVTATSNNEEWGTVTGAGTYEENTYYTLTATPKAGYKFKYWLQDGFKNPGNPQSDGSNQISYYLTKDETYTAVFSPIDDSYVVLSNNTLTFYCDNLDSSREGTIYYLDELANDETPNWFDTKYTGVTFDSSFAKARPTSCYRWFYGGKMETINNIQYLNTSEVTNMEQMFASCINLGSLDLSGFNTSKVTNMKRMFNFCSSLRTLNISSFNTKNVTNMQGMFYYCDKLTTLDVSSFNTANVTNMKEMFSNCKNLTTLDVSSFNTAKVTNMYHMFFYTNSLTSLDLSSFNTKNVTDMNKMFYCCGQLSTLTIGNFDMRQVTDDEDMFLACNHLTTLNITYVSPNLKDGSFDTFFNTTGKTVRYVLNDNSIVTTDAGSNIPTITEAATYTRTINEEWETLYVPFDIKINGDEPFELYDLDGFDIYEGIFNTSIYEKDRIIKANTPVFIHNLDKSTVSIKACNLNITPPEIVEYSTSSPFLSGTYGQDLSDGNGGTERAPIRLIDGFFLKKSAAREKIFFNSQERPIYILPFRASIIGINVPNTIFGSLLISNISYFSENQVNSIAEIVLGKRKVENITLFNYNNDDKLSISDITALIQKMQGQDPSTFNISSITTSTIKYNGNYYTGYIAD